MRDLSIEEKAKAYDKAKSIVEKYLKSGNAGVIAENTIKKAFPELSEPEDERIRKEIRDFICWATDRGSITKEQREQSNSWLAWLEKQKVTASNEDIEKMRNVAIQACQYMVDNFENSTKQYEDAIAWLEKQGKKRLTWSEDDEKMVRSLMSICDEWVTRHSFLSEENNNIEKIKNWIQSIKFQYTWKPSEEQMNALYTYIYNPQYFNSPDPRMELVISLYNELKRFKG